MSRADLRRTLIALGLFGLAFGFVEAAVVIDLRAVYEPIHGRLHPDSPPGDLFPLLTLADLRAAGPVPLRLLGVELAREAATLVMLAAIALAFARNIKQWLAGFLIAFGVWDLAFYATLRMLIGWPASLGTWDLLFLIPVPWASPVAAPMVVALEMIGAGLAILIRERQGDPASLGRPQVAAIVVGAALMLLAFCWDWQSLSAGGHPADFPWPIFAVGYGTAAAGFVSACGLSMARVIDRLRRRSAP